MQSGGEQQRRALGAFCSNISFRKEKFSRGFSVLYPGLQNIRIYARKAYRNGFLQTLVEGRAQGKEGPIRCGTGLDKGSRFQDFSLVLLKLKPKHYIAAKSMKSNQKSSLLEFHYLYDV